MENDKFYEFRVSKYESKYRNNDVFLKNEWTSIGDIGKTFNGKVFTYSEYEYYERLYLLVVERVCLQLGITQMQVSDLEDYSNASIYRNGTILKGLNMIIEVARDCLREKYWCKLTADDCYFHFGYDYYLYLCSSLDYHCVNDLVTQIGLYVEAKASPYK